MVEERRAWEWAKANALVWTPTMQRTAEQCMGSYEADDAHLADYCYDQILALVCGPSWSPTRTESRSMTRSFAMQLGLQPAMGELGDVREARRLLICLIDKYLPAAAKAADAG